MEPRLLIVTDRTLGPAGRAELAALAATLPERGIALGWLDASGRADPLEGLEPVPLDLPQDYAEGLPTWLAGPLATIKRLSGRQEAEEKRLEAALAAQKPTWVWVQTESDEGRTDCRQIARAARRIAEVQVWLRPLQPVRRPEGFGALEAEEELVGLVDFWLPTTALEGRRLIEQRGVAPQSWAVLPPCLPQQETRLKADGSALRKAWGVTDAELLVGAPEPGEGAAILLKALAAQTQPVRLALLGHAEARERWARQAAELGLSEQVLLVQPAEEPGEASAAFDLMVLPQGAATEAALEALLLGRPLLAAEGAGYEEFVESGANGWLLPPDSKSWAEALSQLLNDRRKREGMGLSGKERFFRLFDAERFAFKVADLLGRG